MLAPVQTEKSWVKRIHIKAVGLGDIIYPNTDIGDLQGYVAVLAPVAGGDSGIIRYTISPQQNITNGDAIWLDWAPGVIVGTTPAIQNFNHIVTAFQVENLGGTVLAEFRSSNI